MFIQAHALALDRGIEDFKGSPTLQVNDKEGPFCKADDHSWPTTSRWLGGKSGVIPDFCTKTKGRLRL